MPGTAAAIPTQTSTAGRSPVATPTHTGQERRTDGGDRRHDAHPAGGQAAVEEGAADAGADPGERTPREVGAGRGPVGEQREHDGAGEGGGHAGERDRPRRRTTRGEAADEVREPVGHRCHEREQDRHQVTTTPITQVATARKAATSSMRIETPTARSAALVDGQAPAAPTRARSAT